MIKLSEVNKRIKKNSEEESRKAVFEIEEFMLSFKNRDEAQNKIIKDNSKKILVTGPAGSGKSMLAIRKILDLYQDNSNFNIVIYTKALKKYLLGKLKKINLKNIEDNLYYEDEFVKLKEYENFDYVIIDEVQDFNFEKLYEYLKNAKEGFFLYGDEKQQIYPQKTKNIEVTKEIAKIDGIKKYSLSTSYRFPKKIAKFAQVINLKENNLINACVNSGEDENTPKLIKFNDFEEEIDYIYSTILNESWKNVGILVRNNDMVDKTYESLRKRSLICDYKNSEKEELDFTNNKPKILTYHSSKGLEFERVFLPQCDIDEPDGKLNYREALYVACTRACQTLIISYNTSRNSNGKSPYLNNINSNYYKFEER